MVQAFFNSLLAREAALGSARLIGQDLVMAKPALDLASLACDEKLELIDDL